MTEPFKTFLSLGPDGMKLEFEPADPGCKHRECCRKHWELDSKQNAFAFGNILMNPPLMPFMVCGTCGNKRCPKATDCDLECTGSNTPGQAGSIYG